MRLQLNEGSLKKQPVWWQNFIGDIDDRYGFSTLISNYSTERYDVIKDELKKVGGVKSGSFILFKDSAKATWFILRWS